MVTRQITSYQEGSLERVRRAKGPDVWMYRWRELQPDGRRVQRKQVVGDVRRYPTKADAKRSVENLRAEVNAKQSRAGKMTVEGLWGRFQLDRFPTDPTTDSKPGDDEPIDEDALSPTTIETYKHLFRLYILPEWKDVLLEDVRPFRVQAWLKGLRAAKPTPAIPGSKELVHKPLAPASKAKLRNQLSGLFSYAILNDLYAGSNPITPVRQSAKRLRKPIVLTVTQMRDLLSKVTEPIHRVAIFIAAATALRRSEIRGLQWGDIEFEARWINLRRGVIRKMRSRLKTEASRAGIPLQPELADVLLEWRKQTPYPADEHWVLASPAKDGKEPIWLETVLARFIRPAAVSAGITEPIGWHTFRRSLGSLMVTMKEHPKVAQELLRHANPRITMELYMQADHDSKRAAQQHTSGLFVIDGKKRAS